MTGGRSRGWAEVEQVLQAAGRVVEQQPSAGAVAVMCGAGSDVARHRAEPGKFAGAIVEPEQCGERQPHRHPGQQGHPPRLAGAGCDTATVIGSVGHVRPAIVRSRAIGDVRRVVGQVSAIRVAAVVVGTPIAWATAATVRPVIVRAARRTAVSRAVGAWTVVVRAVVVRAAVARAITARATLVRVVAVGTAAARAVVVGAAVGAVIGAGVVGRRLGVVGELGGDGGGHGLVVGAEQGAVGEAQQGVGGDVAQPHPAPEVAQPGPDRPGEGLDVQVRVLGHVWVHVVHREPDGARGVGGGP